MRQLKVDDPAGKKDVLGLTVRSHASEYEVAPVMAQVRPMRLNMYADTAPMATISAMPGRKAPGP